jgi:hypothetical protein
VFIGQRQRAEGRRKGWRWRAETNAIVQGKDAWAGLKRESAENLDMTISIEQS